MGGVIFFAFFFLEKKVMMKHKGKSEHAVNLYWSKVQHANLE